MDLQTSKRQVAALTAPRNVVLVGASDRPGSWAARVWRNLNRYGFAGPIYLVNPRRQQLWERPCYPDFAALPEAPDHLVVLVPAAGVPELLRGGAAAGARSATVFSSGFGESADPQGAEHGRRLAAVIAETGLGVSGPNCMGNVCAKSRLVTLTEDRPLALHAGPVALAGQSGGVIIHINRALEERGIAVEYLITSGNEAGLTVADYIAFFASEPELKLIIVYIEAIADVAKFAAACRMAGDAGKAVIALKLGQSQAGRAAALAHTGSLAGSAQAFAALCGDLGAIVADTLDDAVEITELLVHTGPVAGRRLGAMTLSGALRGLLIDAAERHGLSFPPLTPATRAKLEAVLSVGSLIGNPIDGGFAALGSADTFMACLDALHGDPNIDVVLLQETLPREAGSARSEKYIALADDYIATRATKPVAFVTLASHSQTDFSRALRSRTPRVSLLQEANKALRAIERVARRAELLRLAQDAAAVSAPAASGSAAALASKIRALAATASMPMPLNEAQSKRILAAYGIATTQDALVKSAAEAVEAACQLGFPVVLKAVAAHLTHKSDLGAVALDLGSADAVKSAYARILDNLAAQGFSDMLDGMLVCRQIDGGQELVLGLSRDPEIGPVVMVGSGGILVEIAKDIAFGLPPVSRAKAAAMIARTQAARLLGGYRGRPPLDADAVVDALVALGCIAAELGDVIEAVDINPFMVLPKGGVALDALVVLRPARRARAGETAPGASC